MFLLPGIFEGLDGPVISSLTENGPKLGPNCVDDVPVRGARARLIQKHHQRNWDPMCAKLGPGGLKNTRKAIKDNFEHGPLRRLTMF